jgi:hypothetical protein
MTVRWRRWDQERRAREAPLAAAQHRQRRRWSAYEVYHKIHGQRLVDVRFAAHYGRVTIVLGLFVILFAVEGFVIPSYLEE